MAVDGVMGNGVKVGYAATSPTTWIGVSQVLDVEIPGLVADKIPTTVHGGVYKRSMRGLLDVSPAKIMLLADLDPATTASHTALQTLQAAGTTVWWRIEVPSNRARTAYAAFEFQGYVETWTPKAPIEGRQEIEVTVSFDGTSFTRYNPAASAIS